jgi:hypothetical protein
MVIAGSGLEWTGGYHWDSRGGGFSRGGNQEEEPRDAETYHTTPSGLQKPRGGRLSEHEQHFEIHKPTRGVRWQDPKQGDESKPLPLFPQTACPRRFIIWLNPKPIDLHARKAPQRSLPATPADVTNGNASTSRGNDRCSKSAGAAQYEPAGLIR